MVNSGEHFGLVDPAVVGLFGLETIKEEDKDEAADGDPLLLDSALDTHELMEELHIDPALLKVPQHPPVPTLSTLTASHHTALSATLTGIPSHASNASGSTHIDLTDTSTNKATASQTETMLLVMIPDSEPGINAKWKSPHIGSFELELVGPEAMLKRPRLDRHATTPDPPAAVQPPPSISTPEPPKPTTIDPFRLPVAPHLVHLTPTEWIFRRGTSIELRALTIKTKEEFFLFMDMRAVCQWLSTNMSEATWISATSDFNKQMKAAAPSSNISRQPQAVDKHPSALMAKLSTIETAILKRLSNAQSPNYKSEYMPNADVDTIAHLLLFQIR